MNIHYTFSKDFFTRDNLQQLFLSLEWESGKDADLLYEAIMNSHTVVSAWDGDRLVGLANALSDGALTAYFHYVLTMPQYQGRGIGRELMTRILERYKHYQTKVLISYPKAQTFYERLGFEAESDSVPMYLMSRKK